MKENDEELLTIEELDVLESYHLLKCLETSLQYKQVLKSHEQAIDCGDNVRFHNLQCTAWGNQQYGIISAMLIMCAVCNTRGRGYQSEYGRWIRYTIANSNASSSMH